MYKPLLVRVAGTTDSLAIRWPEFNAIPPSARGNKDWFPYVMSTGAIVWDMARRYGPVRLCLMVAPSEFSDHAHRLFGMKAQILPIELAKDFVETRTRWADWDKFLNHYGIEINGN